MLDGDPPSFSHGRAVRTPEEAREVVAEMQALGFDYLKIYSGLDRATFLALADEARRRGVPIAGHVPDAVPPIEAAEAGMRSFEHLWNVLDACIPGAWTLRDSLRTLHRAGGPETAIEAIREAQYRLWIGGFDAACADTLAARLARAGTWQVPTRVVNRSYAFMDSTWTADPRRRWVPPAIQAEWATLRAQILARSSPLSIRASHAGYRQEADLLRRMVAAGVGILAGTDAGDEPFVYPGTSLHDELALLVEVGLTPLQALQATTINPADERDRARQSEAFLLGLFERSDPYQASGAAPTVREVLDRGTAALQSGEAMAPETRARLYSAVGQAFYGIGENERAVALIDSAYVLHRALHGATSPEAMAVANQLANVLRTAGHYEAAADLYRTILDVRRVTTGEASPEVARSLNGLALVLVMRGRSSEAERLLLDALAIDRRASRPTSRRR